MTEVRRVRNTQDKLNQVVESFARLKMDEWFLRHLEGKVKDVFDDGEVDGNDIEDLWEDEFLEDLFNRWDDEGFNFHLDYKSYLDNNFTVSQFIIFWNKCSKWFRSEFSTNVEMDNAEKAWNTVAYWVIKEQDIYQTIHDAFCGKFNEEYRYYKETKGKTSRIPCGVCLENKILYTGCFECKGNYLCLSCYSKVNNECPFCRCKEMVCKDFSVNELETDNWGEWFDRMDCVLESVRNLSSK